MASTMVILVHAGRRPVSELQCMGVDEDGPCKREREGGDAFCPYHLQQMVWGLVPCEADFGPETYCLRPRKTRWMCSLHYGRYMKTGSVGPVDIIGRDRSSKRAVKAAKRNLRALVKELA